MKSGGDKERLGERCIQKRRGEDNRDGLERDSITHVAWVERIYDYAKIGGLYRL